MNKYKTKILLMLFIISLIHGCGEDKTEGVNPINVKSSHTIQDGNPILTIDSSNYNSFVFVYEGDYSELQLTGDDLSLISTQNTSLGAINIYDDSEFIRFNTPTGYRVYAIEPILWHGVWVLTLTEI